MLGPSLRMKKQLEYHPPPPLGSGHHNYTQVNRMSISRRVLAIGGKHCDYGWTGSVFIHLYFL